MKKYTVIAAQDKGDWIALVPEVPGAVTQAKTHHELCSMAAEAIALMLDAAPETFRVEVKEVTVGVWQAVSNALTARQGEQKSKRLAAQATAHAVVSATQSGMTVATTANALNLSTPRIYQIMNEAGISKTQKHRGAKITK